MWHTGLYTSSRIYARFNCAQKILCGYPTDKGLGWSADECGKQESPHVKPTKPYVDEWIYKVDRENPPPPPTDHSGKCWLGEFPTTPATPENISNQHEVRPQLFTLPRDVSGVFEKKKNSFDFFYIIFKNNLSLLGSHGETKRRHHRRSGQYSSAFRISKTRTFTRYIFLKRFGLGIFCTPWTNLRCPHTMKNSGNRNCKIKKNILRFVFYNGVFGSSKVGPLEHLFFFFPERRKQIIWITSTHYLNWERALWEIQQVTVLIHCD